MRRALLVAAGLAAMAAAGLSLLSLPPGFPDGYVSPYDQATGVWATAGTWLLLALGIFILAAALFARLGRATAGAVLALVLAAALWLLDACPRLDWCRAAAEQLAGTMLDDGQGG